VAFASDVKTATPIKHIVIIFGENRSFGHYFGTYPNALNPKGEPHFHPLPGTPTMNGLGIALLNNNPNLNPLNGAGAANPFRFDRSQANTQDMDHDYMAEQLAFDGGVMDLFAANTGSADPPPSAPPATVLTTGQVMGYFDGNTVTALWNYAQHYAMSDNSYSTYFGPSTMGAIDLISGQTRSGNIDIDIAAGHEVGNFRVAATYNCAHAQAARRAVSIRCRYGSRRGPERAVLHRPVGVSLGGRQQVPSEGRWIVVEPPDRSVRLALVRPRETSDACRRIGQDTGLVLVTTNIEALYEEWSRRGIFFPQPPAETPWQGRHAIFQDIDGNRFTLVEYGPIT
jgi:hypothetical protein